jgi:hypothetical protein
LAEDFRAIAANTCTRAIESGDIDAGGLDLALSSLFAGAVPLGDERRSGRNPCRPERLARLHRATGRAYFLPEGRRRPTVVAT